MCMILQKYAEESTAFEKSLDSGYKKENGIFYTDIVLAKKIIDFLKIPDDSQIIDPCCGTGSFILAAIDAGYENVCGADIDKNAVAMCKNTTKNKNIEVMDTLANDGRFILKKFKVKEQMDFVIGNPPYAPISTDITIDTQDYLFLRNVKDSGSNLFVAAIYRAFELVKEGGTISYIVPKNLLHVESYGLLRKMILSKKRILSIVDIGAYFKNVRGEQILLTVKNEFIDDSEIDIYEYSDNEFIKKLSVPQSFYKNEILLFNNITDYKIYRKLEGTYKRFGDICKGYVGRGKSKSEDAITGKDIKKFGFKNIPTPKNGNQVFIQNIYSAESGAIASFAGALEATQTVTVFTDGDEKMCRYIVGVIHSRLCNYYLLKFCYNNSKLTMHTDAKYLKKLPLEIDDATFSKIVNLVKTLEKIKYMTDEWFEMVESLNSLVYEAYKIEKDEAEYIDLEMRRIQSQRWINDKRK